MTKPILNWEICCWNYPVTSSVRAAPRLDACTWILLTRNEEIIKKLGEYGHNRSDLSQQEDLPLWTDDYASIFRIMDKPAWWPSWLGGDSP